MPHPPKTRTSTAAAISGRRWQGVGLSPECLLDPPETGTAPGSPNPARQLRPGQPPRQLQQGQRAATGLGDDPVPDRSCHAGRMALLSPEKCPNPMAGFRKCIRTYTDQGLSGAISSP